MWKASVECVSSKKLSFKLGIHHFARQMIAIISHQIYINNFFPTAKFFNSFTSSARQLLSKVMSSFITYFPELLVVRWAVKTTYWGTSNWPATAFPHMFNCVTLHVYGYWHRWTTSMSIAKRWALFDDQLIPASLRIKVKYFPRKIGHESY